MFKTLRTISISSILLATMYSSQALAASNMNVTQVYQYKFNDDFYLFVQFDKPGTHINCFSDRSDQAPMLLSAMATGKKVNASCNYISWANKYLLNVTGY